MLDQIKMMQQAEERVY